MSKLAKVIVLSTCSLILLAIIIVFEINHWPVGNSVSGLVLGVLGPFVVYAFQDLGDNCAWKLSQRHLLRKGMIDKNTRVRISFAYLFRIKVDNEYLLIKNSRGSEQYQPVGGVYKYYDEESSYLSNHFKIVEDKKIKIDDRTRNDYRLMVYCKDLRKFVRRFDSRSASRERIDNLSREFKEELGEVFKWKNITYRYCGRHMSELQPDISSGYYSLILADIVELKPTEEQKNDIKQLASANNPSFKFVSAEEIKCRGSKPMTYEMRVYIADNGYKILQETEKDLMHVSKVGKEFYVPLDKEN